jgi:hypothetical protein
MRLVTVFALLVLGCGPGRTTFARYPGGTAAFDRTAQDAKAVEIADHVIAAVGGTTKWSVAKQLKWSQVVTQDGKVVVEGEQAWDRWNGRHHARAKRGKDGDIVVMRPLYEDDGHVFMDNGIKMRQIEGGAKEAIAAAKDRWEFDTAVLFMPFLLEEPGTKLTYVGEADSDDGKKLDLIKVSLDPMDRTRTAVYQIAVSRDTNLITRIEIQKAGKSENERLGYAVTQWLDGPGMKYPGTIENIGFKGEVVTFKDLTVAEPDEVLFVPPL